MDQHAGLDVALNEPSISGSGRTANGSGAGQVLAASKRRRRSAPKACAALRQAQDAVLVVFETGPLAAWLHRKLTADGLPAAGIDARHAT